jgi:hypothetical protein
VMTRVALAADAIVSAVAPIKPKITLRISCPFFGRHSPS